jgi:hypothetical protein
VRDEKEAEKEVESSNENEKNGKNEKTERNEKSLKSVRKSLTTNNVKNDTEFQVDNNVIKINDDISDNDILTEKFENDGNLKETVNKSETDNFEKIGNQIELKLNIDNFKNKIDANLEIQNKILNNDDIIEKSINDNENISENDNKNEIKMNEGFLETDTMEIDNSQINNVNTYIYIYIYMYIYIYIYIYINKFIYTYL